jgi:hypothetical protein
MKPDFEIEKLSHTFQIMSDFYQKVSREFNLKLENYIKDNLFKLGFKFSNNIEFYDFTEKRITRISFEENPNYYEFYVDYVNLDNKGLFIGCYSDDFEMNMGFDVTVKINIGTKC